MLEDLIKRLNDKYDMKIKIVYLPKFHIELNPIEMYWAQIKNYFRKMNEQGTNGDKVEKLILEARSKFKNADTNHRLWSRFWRVVKSYNDGYSYKHVMKEYFNQSDGRKSHRKLESLKL